MLSRVASLRGTNTLAPKIMQAIAVRTSSDGPQAPYDFRQIPLSDKYEPTDKYPGAPVPPERDVVNFPTPRMNDYPPPSRFYVFPLSWFEFFQPKTGVSGGYVFLGGMTTFVLSKELWVIEHEFWTGISLMIIFLTLKNKFGPQIMEYFKAEMDKTDKDILDFQEGHRKNLADQVEMEKKAQWQTEASKYLHQAKRDNVGLQLEAQFRDRQLQVFKEVKRRVDYHTTVQAAESSLRHNHLVNWILKEVNKGLTPELEKAAMKQCFADLKGIAKA